MLLFLFVGSLLLRLDARRLFVLLLFHDPPRTTRDAMFPCTPSNPRRRVKTV